MIEGLLSLARADSQPKAEAFCDVELRLLCTEIVQSIKPLAEMKGLTLEILSVDEPVSVWARSSDLRKVLTILLDNAIKYTPARGRIEVRIGRFGTQPQIEVRDTGVGIAAEDIPHIFERFYRTDRGRSREAGGVGLGLSIAQTIATDHAARIVVGSQADGGSSFRVLFPEQ